MLREGYPRVCRAKRRLWRGKVRELPPYPYLSDVEERLLERRRSRIPDKRKKTDGPDEAVHVSKDRCFSWERGRPARKRGPEARRRRPDPWQSGRDARAPRGSRPTVRERPRSQEIPLMPHRTGMTLRRACMMFLPESGRGPRFLSASRRMPVRRAMIPSTSRHRHAGRSRTWSCRGRARRAVSPGSACSTARSGRSRR